jgi:peptidase A4-like protein
VRTVNGGRVLALGAAACLLAAPDAAAAPGQAAEPVAIVSTTGNPVHLSAAGGRVALSARVVGAARCIFEGQRVAFGAHVVLARRPCRSGTATATVAVAANRHGTGVRLAFTVRAVSVSGRIVERHIHVQQAAAVPAVAIVPAAPPDGSVGEPYAFAFSAKGGRRPYTWAVGGSLPAGLHLSRDGVVSGTPIAAGTAHFTLRATDAETPAVTVAAGETISIDAVPPQPESTEASLNWSGYVVYGGPFTAIAGSWNVPAAGPASQDGAATEWVGIGGAGGSTPLIQTGTEQRYSAATGTSVQLAWWEIVPAPETMVPLVVQVGDRMSAAIAQVAPGLWQIDLTDVTTGQSFRTTQPFAGPAGSGEWIVEAPTSSLFGIVDLVGYTPAVTFTDLQLAGPPGPRVREVLVQDGGVVSTPSPFAPAGFTVTYGKGGALP